MEPPFRAVSLLLARSFNCRANGLPRVLFTKLRQPFDTLFGTSLRDCSELLRMPVLSILLFDTPSTLPQSPSPLSCDRRKP